MTGRRTLQWLLAVIVIALNLLTWVGGSRSHSDEIRNRAQRMWDDANQHNQMMAHFAPSETTASHPVGRRPGGPATDVDWCFPLLPGVLVADSSYVIGPLWGKGGVKIVLYYGFGSAELITLWGWIS